MHRTPQRMVALLLAAATWFAPVMAHAKDAVTVSLSAHQVTQQDGREALGPADKAKPGDVLEYRAVYRNTSAEPVRELWATLPIPAGLEYLPRTAAPTQLLASLDGTAYAPVPLMRRERTPQGVEVVRAVPASEYRFLRWSLGTLPARQARTVSARARVAPVAVAAAVR